MSEVDQLFAPEGLLAKELPAFETRPAQVSMARLIEQAIQERSHAVIEAPTGVGKSFAYLIPAALYALRERKKVVISTATIALQEQLIRKDIPLVQQLLPGLEAVLVKGRQNYVSLRRLAYAKENPRAAFEHKEQAHDLQEIAEWIDDAGSGDRADLGFEPDPAVWRQVQSDRGNCRGRKCPTYDRCFFYAARERIEEAQLLVVNHHLYFSDLALKGDRASAILPPHAVVIFDEAHALEDTATEHLGVSLGAGQVRFFLDSLLHANGKGLLADERWSLAREPLSAARRANDDFWNGLVQRYAGRDDEHIRLGPGDELENELAPSLDVLGKALAACQDRADDDNEAMELKAQADKAFEMAGALRRIAGQLLDDYVYWLSLPQGRGQPCLAAHPLAVGGQLQELLWSCLPTAVLTSATLAADDSERFLFLRKRLGLGNCLSARLESPFDWPKQARLLLNQSALDPNSEPFERAMAQWLGDYLEEAEGGCFVLFTSYRQLAAVHGLVAGRLERRNRFVLRQGAGIGRSQMIDLFKSVGNAVLFGTSSFWEGVDVRGDALSHVIITKLPFEVPNHPLVEARLQAITAQGGNAFLERTVPEAILRLKQGVGRLIRTATDTGTVVILDHRVLTKTYGRYFLRALPPMTRDQFALAQYLH